MKKITYLLCFLLISLFLSGCNSSNIKNSDSLVSVLSEKDRQSAAELESDSKIKFFCSRCSKPIDGGCYVDNGRKICNSCHRELMSANAFGATDTSGGGSPSAGADTSGGGSPFGGSDTSGGSPFGGSDTSGGGSPSGGSDTSGGGSPFGGSDTSGGGSPFGGADTSGGGSPSGDSSPLGGSDTSVDVSSMPVHEDPSSCCMCGCKLCGLYYKTPKGNSCQSCYEAYFLPKCCLCKEIIDGGYYKIPQGSCCPRCYEEKVVSRCFLCGRKLGKYFKTEQGKCCVICYEEKVAPRCYLCQQPIMGFYYRYGNESCCRSCHDRYPRCSSCYAPMLKPAWMDEDFILCGKCSENNITEKSQLVSILSDVKSHVRSSCGGIQFDYITVDNIKLTNSSDLIKLGMTLSYGSGRPMGYCSTSYRGSYVSHVIYIQNGMSPEQAFAVLAHECGHAWDHQNKDNIEKNKTPIFSEGFAEWVAYNALISKGDEMRAEAVIKNPDPVYGEGARRMIELEKQYMTKSNFLNFVNTHYAFPE